MAHLPAALQTASSPSRSSNASAPAHASRKLSSDVRRSPQRQKLPCTPASAIDREPLPPALSVLLASVRALLTSGASAVCRSRPRATALPSSAAVSASA